MISTVKEGCCMSETINPLMNPEKAAHEVILELIRANKISPRDIPESFTYLLNHYRSELKRLQSENKNL